MMRISTPSSSRWVAKSDLKNLVAHKVSRHANGCGTPALRQTRHSSWKRPKFAHFLQSRVLKQRVGEQLPKSAIFLSHFD